MRLDPPPLWEHLLLEQPWPAVVALGVTALVLTVLAQRHRSRRLRVAAWALALAAGGVYALAWGVTTDRERLLAATRAFVATTESPMQIEHLAANWLGRHTVLAGPDGEPWLEREQIERTLARLDQRHHIESHTVRRLDAQVIGPGRGRSVLELSTHAGGGGPAGYGPLRTEWDLYWEQASDGQWRVREIRWVSFRHQPADQRWLR